MEDLNDYYDFDEQTQITGADIDAIPTRFRTATARNYDRPDQAGSASRTSAAPFTTASAAPEAAVECLKSRNATTSRGAIFSSIPSEEQSPLVDPPTPIEPKFGEPQPRFDQPALTHPQFSKPHSQFGQPSPSPPQSQFA